MTNTRKVTFIRVTEISALYVDGQLVDYGDTIDVECVRELAARFSNEPITVEWIRAENTALDEFTCGNDWPQELPGEDMLRGATFIPRRLRAPR